MQVIFIAKEKEVTLKNNLIGCIWHLPYIGVFSSVGDM
jgi:hypothetical protein